MLLALGELLSESPHLNSVGQGRRVIRNEKTLLCFFSFDKQKMGQKRNDKIADYGQWYTGEGLL